MKLNQFAVYRVDQQTAGKALWHLPYQEARQQNVSITVENYRLISIHEMQENEKVADIWKRTKNQCEVSDVLVLNKNGEISCYYVDENYPQYLIYEGEENNGDSVRPMTVEDKGNPLERPGFFDLIKKLIVNVLKIIIETLGKLFK